MDENYFYLVYFYRWIMVLGFWVSQVGRLFWQWSNNPVVKILIHNAPPTPQLKIKGYQMFVGKIGYLILNAF